MKSFSNFTIKEYLRSLSARQPVPGGGSASALAAALGVSLIAMVANYSKGKGASKAIETRMDKIRSQCGKISGRLMILADLDAKAYLNVVAARKGSEREKRAALKEAISVPAEVCKLCYKAILLMPFLVEKGNKYLLSDVEVAAELLLAAFNSAKINISVNQKSDK